MGAFLIQFINLRGLIMELLKFKKENIKAYIKNFMFIFIGTFILSFGTELFIIPTGLDTGGVSGIGILFKYLNANISVEVVITIITWVLFFLGLIFLGVKFSLQTLLSTIFYPLFLFIIKILMNHFPFLILENSISLIGNQAMINLLSAIAGGFFVGAGCGIAFLGGGSTGGVDIISFIICKYFKRAKSSVCMFIVDALIVLLGFILNPEHDLALCLMGVFSAFIAALVIDKVLLGSSKAFCAYVITDKYEELTNEIIINIDRSTSIFDIEGGYSKEMKKMVMISFTYREYAKVITIISKIDSKAFINIYKAHEINGEGFKPLNDAMETK